MVPKIVIDGWHAFWEATCKVCGELVTESVLHDSAECEECGARVTVALGGGEA